ncbi:MAG: LysR family transcriptional regulator [Pseudomonadota bacterium]
MIGLTLRQLECFVWTASLGSFRSAGRHLHTTQPAISNNIRSLEERLGVRLLDRSGTPVRLTAAGQKVFAQAQKALELTASIDARAILTDHHRSTLRLGVSETIVHSLLPDFLRHLRESFPLVDVDVSVDVTSTLREELMSHNIDLAFLMGPLSHHRVDNLRLTRFALVWACAPEIALPKARTVAFEDMLSFPIITYARNTRPFQEIHNRCNAVAHRAGRIFPVSSLAATLRMARDGIGVATLPAQMVQPYIEKGELKCIDCDWHPADLSFTASYLMQPSHTLVHKVARMSQSLARRYEKATLKTWPALDIKAGKAAKR